MILKAYSQTKVLLSTVSAMSNFSPDRRQLRLIFSKSSSVHSEYVECTEIINQISTVLQREQSLLELDQMKKRRPENVIVQRKPAFD